ncbi:MAG: hypothetical protein KBB83_02165 [Alphaproteobacteria bacterium]|nr:hypothetical protein [Alphaproteobacteria bacterium]
MVQLRFIYAIIGFLFWGLVSATYASSGDAGEPDFKKTKIADESDDYDSPEFLQAFNTHMAVNGYDGHIEVKPEYEPSKDDSEFLRALEATEQEYFAKRQAQSLPQTPQSPVRKTVMDMVHSPVSPGRTPAATHVHKHKKNPVLFQQAAPKSMEEAILIGLRIKFLANVWGQREDENVNVFVPSYVQLQDSEEESKGAYFLTKKEQICVFASGGTGTPWEKCVARVYEILFQQKVKIIRWNWVRKHIVDPRAQQVLDSYENTPEALHSELYFSLFAKYVFQKNGALSNQMRIDAYSWWEVCDQCAKHFDSQKEDFLSVGKSVSFRIAASNPYTHSYDAYAMDVFSVNPEMESQVRLNAWNLIVAKAANTFPRNAQTRERWTNTPEGLWLTKWLGQMYRKNAYLYNSVSEEDKKKGILCAFVKEIGRKRWVLEGCIGYLTDVNWDLSCFYLSPYPYTIQAKWEKHHKQLAMPHFGWEMVSEERDESKQNSCEMCGHEKLTNYYVFKHAKHSKTLRVGVLCKEIMMKDEDEVKTEVDAATQREYLLEQQIKFANSNFMPDSYEDIDKSESKALLKWLELQAGDIRTIDITRSKKFGLAADFNPLLKYLMGAGRVERVSQSTYRVIEGKPD